MAAMAGSSNKRSYDEIEPFCKWKKGEEHDILEVHLLGFKKEQLTVQINSVGVLTISGERPVDEMRWSRFHKETKVSKDCNRNEIRAKFSSGILYITMPKIKPTADPTENQPLQGVKDQQDQESENPKQEVNRDEGSTLSKSTYKPTSYKDGLISSIKMGKKTAMKVSLAVAVVLAVTYGAYMTCKYHHYVENLQIF